MNKKSKKTLKNAFNIPEPKRKEKFFSSLEMKQKKRLSFNIPLYISTAVTAVVVIGIWGGIKNLPYFEQPDNIDTTVYSETTSLSYHTESSAVQTTVSTEKNTITVKTSGISTVSGTEKIKTEKNTETTANTTNTTVSGAGTTKTVTTTTSKENNNISHKPTTEIRTTEKTSEPETEYPQTTTKINTTKTNIRTTTITTVPSHTTSMAGELNYATTTIHYEETIPTGEYTQTSVITEDFPIVPVTTTNNNAMSPEIDFTVAPDIQYYPNGEIYTIDSESTDSITSTTVDKKTFSEMAKNSDVIAVVEVNEMIYTGFDGKPYTQENVFVKNVIHGDVSTGSIISIYCKGGYIPASEYSSDKYIANIDNLIENNVIIFDYAGNNEFSEVGDVYMCFLKKSDGIFPDGSYHLTGFTDISKFAIFGDNFVNLHSRIPLTSDEIQSFLNQ